MILSNKGKKIPQVNANLKADTTDGLLNRKKSMHLSAFQYRIDEIKNALQVQYLKFHLPIDIRAPALLIDMMSRLVRMLQLCDCPKTILHQKIQRSTPSNAR